MPVTLVMSYGPPVRYMVVRTDTLETVYSSSDRDRAVAEYERRRAAP
jgi:hypothetical protein